MLFIKKFLPLKRLIIGLESINIIGVWTFVSIIKRRLGRRQRISLRSEVSCFRLLRWFKVIVKWLIWTVLISILSVEPQISLLRFSLIRRNGGCSTWRKSLWLRIAKRRLVRIVLVLNCCCLPSISSKSRVLRSERIHISGWVADLRKSAVRY